MTVSNWSRETLDAATTNHLRAWSSVNLTASDDDARREAARYQNFVIDGQAVLIGNEDEIWVKVPKFTIIKMGPGKQDEVKLPAGIRRVRRSVAENWYAIASGIEECEDPTTIQAKLESAKAVAEEAKIEAEVQRRLTKLGVRPASFTSGSAQAKPPAEAAKPVPEPMSDPKPAPEPKVETVADAGAASTEGAADDKGASVDTAAAAPKTLTLKPKS